MRIITNFKDSKECGKEKKRSIALVFEVFIIELQTWSMLRNNMLLKEKEKQQQKKDIYIPSKQWT